MLIARNCFKILPFVCRISCMRDTSYRDDHSPLVLTQAARGRMSYRPPDGLPETDLAEIERPLDTEISPVRLRVGRLVVLDCGGGWLKVDLLCPQKETEAELLPPQRAAELIQWFRMKPG